MTHLDRFFGIFSESAPEGITPGVDSFIGRNFGQGGIFHEFEDDSAEKREGNISKRTTVTVGPNGPWVVWFAAHGLEGTADSITKDMSSFAGGIR